MTVFRLAALGCVAVSLTSGRAHAQSSHTPAAAALDSALVAQERGLYDALAHHDVAAFNKGLGADFVFVDPSGTMAWKRSMTADMLKRCSMATFSMDDVKTTRASADVMVLTYRWTGEETCDGRKSPSPVNVLSVWQKRGGRWMAVAHSETPSKASA